LSSLKDQLVQILNQSSAGLTAKDLARSCKVTKTEVNKILYLEKSTFISDGSRVPVWLTTKSSRRREASTNTYTDRISPPKVLDETLEIEVRGRYLKLDVVLLDKTRNEDLYSFEVKSPGHILVAVSRLFEDEISKNSKENSIAEVQAWQVFLVAEAALEYLYLIGLEPQGDSRSTDISLIVRKLTSQISEN
jgi:hypothetical protein